MRQNVHNQIRRWLPIALCCLPGVVVAGIVGLSMAAGGVGIGASLGPLGLGLIAVAALACPLSMGLIMMRRPRQHDAPGNSTMSTDCCAPSEPSMSEETEAAARRLAALRERRELLEREVAQLQKG